MPGLSVAERISSWILSPSGKARLQGKRDNYEEIHDLTQLENITFDNVLDCLVERYALKKYYTFAGTMLVSLNPCLQNSRKSLTADQLSCQFQDHYEKRNSPHVFSVGRKCLKNLTTVGCNQVIVVSGNSGAGKTTATQQLLRYFIELSRPEKEIRTPNGLDKKIYFATLILESFGNAGTAVNPNSSRFGRFVQLNFDGESGSIMGAQIRTCLLEKHRVSKCGQFERNFHIFYYIFVGLDKGQLRFTDFANNADAITDWRTLIPRNFQDGVKDSDGEEFDILYQSLKSLKMTSELQKVFSITFGIMILLNIRFVSTEDQSPKSPDSGKVKVPSTEKEFTIEDMNPLDTLSDIFGVELTELIDILVARKITAGTGSRRQSIFRKPCQSIRECEERRDALTGYLYDALFHHVLARLNISVSGNSTDFGSNGLRMNRMQTISLLDLYGFEKLENNQLEQLCINYANERLQKVHVQRMKSHFNEIATWEIDYETLELDNVVRESNERIDCLQSSIFQILNEECLLNRETSDCHVFERIQIATKNNKYIETGKARDCTFIIKHYAMEVKYELNGMIAKNTDNVPQEFNELFGNSSKLFLKSLISDLNRQIRGTEPTPQLPKNMIARNKSQREKTILQRFKVSVDELISELGLEENQDLHFIRCIRPNNELAEGKVQMDTVRQQLFSSGIVDIIRITGNGFPIRIGKSKFYKDFPSLVKTYFASSQTDLSLLLPTLLNKYKTEIKFGETQMFLTENAWGFLVNVENYILRRSAIIMQRNWRSYSAKRKEVPTLVPVNNLIDDLHKFHITSLTESKEDEKNYIEVDSLGGGDSNETDHKLTQMSDKTIQDNSTMKIDRKSQSCTFKQALTKLQAIMLKMNLRIGDGIVTRGRVYKGPIHLYTKKTVLVYGHVIPNRLTSRGFWEAESIFEDAN